MNTEKSLQKDLLEKLSNFRETVPVFRIRERRVDEIEADGLALARRFMAAHYKVEPRFDLKRLEDETIIYLPDGARAHAFHKSGALMVKQDLGPVEKLITDTTDKEVLTQRTIEAAKHLELDRCPARGERFVFERLWQIKATGTTTSGERGRVVLCRVVGAFRRYLHDLPVWGRASVFVELAGDNVIESAGIDWRPIVEEPIDYAKVIDPEAAADHIIGELNAGIPGGTFTADDYTPELFSLGYFSLPERQEQAYMQPVYAAMLRARSWANINHLIVIPGATTSYESICRIAVAPPRLTAKLEPRSHNQRY